MKKIYQKLALTGVLAALLLSAGCGGAKETSADETAGDVQAVAEQKTDSKADMELSETLEVDAGSSEAGTETLETNTETQTQGYTFTDDLGREVTVKSADRVAALLGRFTAVGYFGAGCRAAHCSGAGFCDRKCKYGCRRCNGGNTDTGRNYRCLF